MPELVRCLNALPSHLTTEGAVEVILVDSGSHDDTTTAMLEFGRSRSHVRVFRVDGEQNAAVARNVIIRNCPTGSLMLLDGDIVLNPKFLTEAFDRIRRGAADVICGNLEYVFKDTGVKKFAFPQSPYDAETRSTGGNLLLSPSVVQRQVEFDERLVRNEDRDFTLELSKSFRLIRIPESMGQHFTLHYLSSGRIGAWIAEMYDQWPGVLIRKRWRNGSDVKHIILLESGIFVGLLAQVVLAVSILMNVPLLVLGCVLGIALDAWRFARRGELSHYLPRRLVSPWIFLWGLLRPFPSRPSYVVTRIL